MTPSQTDQVRAALLNGDRLTHRIAENRFGCCRLAARIREIRMDGLEVNTTRHPDGYAVYSIPQEGKA